jgi:hypothetical protein
MTSIKPPFKESFTTDGCSGGMTTFWKYLFNNAPPWNDDCVIHDKAYWEAGTKERRLKADRILAGSVARKGYPLIAAAMYYAVRIGGHPIFPFSWRWDYGRSYVGGYDERDKG